MSGHSKWKQIKRQKGVSDQKKGKIFSKLIRAVTLAAKESGGDPETNFKLRLALEKAREANMPQDNIERAIKKATGEAGEKPLESILYEAYGPGGIALLIETLTDNRNRTTGEIKNILAKGDGRLGENNSVKWLFEEKGIIHIESAGKNTEEIEFAAIDAGAEDIQIDDSEVMVITKKENCLPIKNILAEKYTVVSATIEMVPKNKVAVDDDHILEKIQTLVDNLEEQEDVSQVFTNIE